jgi:hypothetical protein
MKGNNLLPPKVSGKSTESTKLSQNNPGNASEDVIVNISPTNG